MPAIGVTPGPQRSRPGCRCWHPTCRLRGRWLDDVRQGVIEDADDELCGQLLKALYPDWLSVDDVLDHFHPPKSEILVGAYWYFWQITITKKAIDMAALADALPAFMAKYPGHIPLYPTS